MKGRTKLALVTNACLALLVLAVAAVCFLPAGIPASSLADRVYYNGDREGVRVSLMFNVYWGGEYLGGILDVLEEYGVYATFFIGGCWADDNAELVREIAERGHELGNHGYFHKDQDKLGYDGNAEETLACAAESLAYYGETFGAYAYGSYTVVQTDFPYGGMEYPMLSMIAADLRKEEIPVVVAHETAHQWWYASVGSDQFGNAWQDEGLAEFSAALFLDAHPAYGVSYEDCVTASEQSYRAYFSVNSQLTAEQNTAMQRPLTEFSGEYEYRNIAYDKGVILFDRLRDTLGDQKFFAALRAYAKANGGKIASPAELVSCFAARGAHAEGIFDSFLQGTCVI